MGDGLLAFLNARLDEDKAAAIAATPGPWEFEGDDLTDDEVYSIHNGEHGDLIGQTVAYTRGRGRQVANGKHIARHDPARELREVAAKRALIVHHDDNHDCADLSGTEFPYVGCSVIRALAAVYSNHPDYREEWRLLTPQG